MTHQCRCFLWDLAAGVANEGLKSQPEARLLTLLVANDRDSKRFSDAAPFLKAVLNSQQRAFGSDHEPTPDTEHELSITYLELGRPGDGVPHWMNVLELAAK